MRPLQTELKRLRELRERAEPNKWSVDHKNCDSTALVANDGDHILFTADFYFENDEDNFKFCATAANRWLQLIESLEITIDVLKEISKPVDLDNSILTRPLKNMGEANQALMKIEQLLCGEENL